MSATFRRGRVNQLTQYYSALQQLEIELANLVDIIDQYLRQRRQENVREILKNFAREALSIAAYIRERIASRVDFRVNRLRQIYAEIDGSLAYIDRLLTDGIGRAPVEPVRTAFRNARTTFRTTVYNPIRAQLGALT